MADSVTDSYRVVEQAPVNVFAMDMESEMLGLHNSIEAMLPLKHGKMIQFVGSVAGEGATTLVWQFARVLGTKVGKSVLLLDEQWHEFAPELFSKFGSEQNWTLEVEKGDEIAIGLHKIDEFGFSICRALEPTPPASFSTIFNDENENRFLKVLREQFDVILVDSLPINESSESLMIVRRMDGIVLVVEAENTRWSLAESSKRKILKSGGNILGIIFNRRKQYLPQFMKKVIA